MRSACLILCGLALLPAAAARAESRSASELSGALGGISIDPAETYYVRDLQLDRGGVKFYLTEGILAFATPVAGRRVAAIFTTAGVEAGDAEVIVMPPRRSERASLAAFTGTPNLDEHFQAATFLFSDDTVREIIAGIQERPVRRATEFAASIKSVADPILRDQASRLDLRLVEAMLDRHSPEQGFFYSLISAPKAGNFAVLYEPGAFEPVTIGRPTTGGAEGRFKLWTAFRPKAAPSYTVPAPRIHSYNIEATVLPDLSMKVDARFDVDPSASDGRVLPFVLSDRMRVTSATVDDKPAEIMQRSGPGGDFSSGSFLLIPNGPLPSGGPYHVAVHYEGTVVRQVQSGAYFVDERNAWYPQTGTTLAKFDLIFRIPKNLRLVATGEEVSDSVDGDLRVVHRRTSVPEMMAGFNLGAYEVKSTEIGGYRVECYAVSSSTQGLAAVADQTSGVLDFYSQRWGKLPIHSVAVSPIPGYFGQGFPGLIYLSTVTYIPQADRPVELRSSQMDSFFSELLLPHEVAHQWWGNLLSAADYRTGWLIEAMANDSALQFLEKKEGTAAVNQILEHYRQDLLQVRNGRPVDAAGPVDFGFRLMENDDAFTWHTVVYEKGTWILRMLRQRLGNEQFLKMQTRMLQDFASKPITNEDFRSLASKFVRRGDPDPDLSLFFDTWIYGTGIPALSLERKDETSTLTLAGTEDDYSADIPLSCEKKSGRSEPVLVRAVSGTQSIGNRALTCKLPAPSDFLYSPASRP